MDNEEFQKIVLEELKVLKTVAEDVKTLNFK